MKDINQKIRNAIRRDAEDVPLGQLPGIRKHGRHRLPIATEMLAKSPREPLVVELYLTELFAFTMRQIGGDMCLGPTFDRTVKELDEATLKALPEAFIELAKLTPISVVDPRLLAHSLVIDGRLANWLMTQAGKEKKRPKEDGQAIYRRLAAKYHPDREGGNAEVMADLNELWRSKKKEAQA